MQATRQNTRQLQVGESELMEWYTYGFEWSILNYGPGILWFSYTPGVDAAPGEVQATRLDPGYSFTDSASAPRYLLVTLHAEAAALTYCLNTNQRSGPGSMPPGGGGAPDPPSDGILYGRRGNAWERCVDAAGDTISGPLMVRIDPIAHLDISGDRFSNLVLARGIQARWIIGCTHANEAGYPFGLFFARMSADGSTVQDFPFSIRPGDGRVVMTSAEADVMFKLGALDQPALNEFVTRFWIENGPLPYVRKIGDIMTGTLRLEPGNIVLANIRSPTSGESIIRLEGGAQTILEFVNGLNEVQFVLGTWYIGPTQGFRIGRHLGGTNISIDLSISPLDGHVELNRPQNAQDPIGVHECTRKAYVDARTGLGALIGVGIIGPFSGTMNVQSVSTSLAAITGNLQSTNPITPLEPIDLGVVPSTYRPAHVQFLPILFTGLGVPAPIIGGMMQILANGLCRITLAETAVEIRSVLINVLYPLLSALPAEGGD